MTGSTATGFIGWVQTYGPYIQFFVQILFWIVLGAVSVWAVLLFKKYVDAKVAALAGPAAPVAPLPVDQKDDAVAVEEFVD